MRVTQRSISTTSLAGLQSNLSRLGALQQQLSSGKLISRPSDSPTGTVQAMQTRSQIRANEQFSRNAADGTGWLGVQDSALTTALDLTRRVRDLTVQGMNTGAAGASSREALATEIDQIRESLVTTANSSYGDRPVFGGTTTGTRAYAADGTYVGDSGAVTRMVADGTTLRVDTPGPAAFGTGSSQLFTVLTSLSDHLRNDPTGLATDLDNLDVAAKTMQNAVADVGARYSRSVMTRQAADDLVLDLRSRLADVEDIDIPKTVTDLQMAQVAYQAALGAAAKVIQPSLMDFLR